MNTLYTRNSDLEEEDEPRERDREIALGTSVIIGIFFALVLICAIFFAFGYSLGRRSALPASGVPPAATATAPAAATDSSTDTGSSNENKPASGVPESANANSSASSSSSPQQAAPPVTQAPAVVPARVATRPTAASRAVAPAAVTPGAGQMVVQVAAVSRPGDANMLMNALKRHGYDAAIHSSPQDKLLHVQIGPFTTKQDADAMRQRLIADGYNAIVK